MNGLRALRQRVLTPNESETRLDVRGFHVKDGPSRDRLETVGRSFLTGYGHAAEAPEPSAAEAHLERVPRQFRGFAYEGAAMGFAVRDALPFGRHDHVARFLAGRGDDHIYMAYIGVGWAMARMPRFTRPRLYAPDPLLRWLVLDGYGFHQAYFRTRRYVHEQYQDPAFPWPAGGPSGYANRVIDQGIGRALWFVGGTDARLRGRPDRHVRPRAASRPLQRGRPRGHLRGRGRRGRTAARSGTAPAGTGRRSPRAARSPPARAYGPDWYCRTPTTPRGCSAG